jgi:hypothetical protein
MINADFVETASSNGYRAEPMAFHCLACKTQPGWYRQGGVIVMGCCCGVAALNYAKLPFFPQTDWEWLEWLSEADSVMKLHSEQTLEAF